MSYAIIPGAAAIAAGAYGLSEDRKAQRAAQSGMTPGGKGWNRIESGEGKKGPGMAEAAIGAGAAIVGGYMQYKSAKDAQKQQAAAFSQAEQAQREKDAEEQRRYQERWDDYQRKYQDWQQRRAQAQQQVSGGGTRRFAGRTADEINSSPVPTYGTSQGMFGVDPKTGKPRTLGDVAMGWNDWGQYGVQ